LGKLEETKCLSVANETTYSKIQSVRQESMMIKEIAFLRETSLTKSSNDKETSSRATNTMMFVFVFGVERQKDRKVSPSFQILFAKGIECTLSFPMELVVLLFFADVSHFSILQ
jgi:hypothetical protein